METSHFIVGEPRSESGSLAFICILKQVNIERGQITIGACCQAS